MARKKNASTLALAVVGELPQLHQTQSKYKIGELPQLHREAAYEVLFEPRLRNEN